MAGVLISGFNWRENGEEWFCDLLSFNKGYSWIKLKPGSHLSLKVFKRRFCVGFSKLMSQTVVGKSPAYWKELNPCPQGAEVKQGTRCRRCAFLDAARTCLVCDGRECHADPAIRHLCEGSVAYVYLASFGEGRIKAGVSRKGRVLKRWIEQGADAAKRVLVGNGREVRRFERQIQDELGVLRQVKAKDKLDVVRSEKDLQESIRLLNIYEKELRGLFPEDQYFHEEPQIIYPIYGLEKIDRRPLELEIRGGRDISGRVLGVKGPVLLLNAMGLPRAIRLNKLVGRRVDTNNLSMAKTQSGLDMFILDR